MNQNIEERTFAFSTQLLKFYKETYKQDIAMQIILRQLIRAGTSIGANTTEGRASSSKKDFINFHYHALKSARETIYWLRILQKEIFDVRLNNECGRLILEVGEISKILGKIVINAKRTK